MTTPEAKPDPFYSLLASAHDSIEGMKSVVSRLLELARTDRSHAIALLDEMAGEEIYHHGRRPEYMDLIDWGLQQIDRGYEKKGQDLIYRVEETVEPEDPPTDTRKIICLPGYS